MESSDPGSILEIQPQEVKHYNPGVVDDLYKDRDPDHGGVLGLITGQSGCGKTNALVRSVRIGKNLYGNVPVWRGMDACDWKRFHGKEPITVWLHENLIVHRFTNRTQQKDLSLDKIADDVHRWGSARELVRELGKHKNRINVVYTCPHDQGIRRCADQWTEVFNRLTKRTWAEDVEVGFDEFDDIAPMNDSTLYARIGTLKRKMKDLRRHRVNAFFCTHEETLIDHRVLSKIPWSVYMKKAKVKRDRAPAKLNFDVINNLEKGEAIVCNRRYQPFDYKFEGNTDDWVLDLEYDTEED